MEDHARSGKKTAATGTIFAMLVCKFSIMMVYVMTHYVAKLSGQRSKPVRIARRKLFLPSAASLAGSVLGIAAIGFVASHFSVPLLIAPFGASAVLLFSVYDSPLAQPRNTLAGHLLSAMVGAMIAIASITYFGNDDQGSNSYMPIVISVALSIFVMQVLRITHPPAGATAFIASSVIIDGSSFISFLTAVGAGAVILVAIAVLFNNAVPGRKYPVYW